MSGARRSPFAPLVPGADGVRRRSLVLAGGGMRVAYQAGVLAALEEEGLRFDHVDGSSGGTLNLSMLLTGQGGAEICERWRTLDPRGFTSLLPAGDYLSSPHWPAIGSSSGLRQHVFPHLGIDAELVRRAEGLVGTYNVCNFATKTAEVVEHHAVDADLLVAAVSLPVLLPAVARAGTAYTDAVWIRDSNVPEAVRRGSDEIWLVWCIGNTPTYRRGLFRQYVHMIEMAANGGLRRDLALVEAAWPSRPVRLHVIKPEHPIPLDPAYFLGRVDATTLVGLGYQDARRYLVDPRPRCAPFGDGVTAMRDASPGAALRLECSGPFALGATDPEIGAGEGRRRDTTVALHLRLSRRGDGEAAVFAVAGAVDLPGQPPGALVEDGTAHLGGGGLSARICLRHGSARSSLAVEPTGDPRTVRLALREEQGDAGSVLGAGEASLGGGQLWQALVSIRATGTDSSLVAMRARTSVAADLVRSVGPLAGRRRRRAGGAR